MERALKVQAVLNTKHFIPSCWKARLLKEVKSPLSCYRKLCPSVLEPVRTQCLLSPLERAFKATPVSWRHLRRPAVPAAASLRCLFTGSWKMIPQPWQRPWLGRG